MQGFRGKIHILFLFLGTLVSPYSFAADVMMPLPCETNPQGSNQCEIGLRSCEKGKADFRILLQENVEKIIDFHQEGRDVNIESQRCN